MECKLLANYPNSHGSYAAVTRRAVHGLLRLSGVWPSGLHVIVKVIHLDRLRYRPLGKKGLREQTHFCLNPLRQYKFAKQPRLTCSGYASTLPSLSQAQPLQAVLAMDEITGRAYTQTAEKKGKNLRRPAQSNRFTIP